MLDLLAKFWRLLLVPLVVLAFLLGAYFYFYTGSYDAPPTPNFAFEGIRSPSSSMSSFAEVPTIHQGTFLVDAAHANNYTEGEISTLRSRVSDRGYGVQLVGDLESSPSQEERLRLLEVKLRQADSLAVILPQEAYTGEEMDLVERFVEKGGRLLLIGDPTRHHHINSVAERFGIAFQADYLFNTAEYDINFQNIFVRDFRPDEITRGLSQVALYTAGSIRSSAPGLAFTDENTRSSMVERIEPFYPIVKTNEGRVLAISDLTFMIPPQNSILDNDRLISNIAHYLTGGRRSFELGDFPFFFKSDVDILLGRSSLFDLGAQLKALLSGFQINSEIRGVEDLTRDVVYLGLYDDSPDVAQYLTGAAIQVDEGTLRTPFTPDIEKAGAAIIFLHSGQQRHVLAILGNSQDALMDMVNRLRSGNFRAGLVSDLIGVYRTP